MSDFCPPHFHRARPFWCSLYRLFLMSGSSPHCAYHPASQMMIRLYHAGKIPCRGGCIYFRGCYLGECLMEKPPRVAGKGSVPNSMPDDLWTQLYPTLTEYLTHESYADGSRRQTATLTVFVDQGVLKVALNDRDLEQSLYRTGNSFNEILESIEACLVFPGKDDWRAWGKRKRK